MKVCWGGGRSGGLLGGKHARDGLLFETMLGRA